MVETGSYLNLYPRNDSILTKKHTYYPVKNLNYESERGFPASLVPASIISTVDAIPTVSDIKSVNCSILFFSKKIV